MLLYYHLNTEEFFHLLLKTINDSFLAIRRTRILSEIDTGVYLTVLLSYEQ